MSIPSSGSSTARSASITSSRVGIRSSRVSRQPILGELVPLGPRIDERVVLRTDLGIAVERAEADRDLVALGPAAAEEAGAADRAEDLHCRAAFGPEDAQQLLAGQQAESLPRHPALRQAEGARVLAAQRAVAVVCPPKGELDLEAHATAEAAAADRPGHSVPEQPDLLAALAREEVDPVHEPDPVAAGAHDEGMGPGTVGQEAHAAEQVAVRDAGRGDDHLAGREVLDREHSLDVLHPALPRLLDLAARGRPELGLELASETAQRGCREHRLARAPDPDREVVVRATDRGGDRRRHVAVLDQLDPSTGGTDLLDQV